MLKTVDGWPPEIGEFIVGSVFAFSVTLVEKLDDLLLCEKEVVFEAVTEYLEVIRKEAYERLAALEAGAER